MVNTRFNGVRPVAPVNAPAEASTARRRVRGRGRGRERATPTWDGAPVGDAPRNETPPAHHDEIEENIKVENEENVGKEKEVQAETTCIPHLDPVLAQQIMSFLKRLVGSGVLHSVQATQAPTNPPIASTAPKVGGTGGMMLFFRPFVGFCYDW
uniref:'chromo' domain containing protein n=1 Tax=Solanum tuberosum TaxID=4113 RepID=M1DFW5_SOLTU